jgi:hypothetical protein
MKKRKWNAARVYDALGKIGYSPASALLDMVDNSVSAGAKKVDIRINLAATEKTASGKPKAVIESFEIFDDGRGMNEDGIDNALTFGSSEAFYSAGTLSKFGLGLKSAASSLGKRLEIVSRVKGAKCFTAVLDRDLLTTDYEYDFADSSPEDTLALDNYVGKGLPGTIIRIRNVRHDSMPKAAEISGALERRIGVTFFYFLSGLEGDKRAVVIAINGVPVQALDPLFRNELPATGANLDERTWDGTTVRWISKPHKIQLDFDGKCQAELAVTQLPHPPSMANAELLGQAKAREKYLIDANNYGVYIYRNGRLISWADRLEGMINQDQDLYSFRGCLRITSDADDVLNLDVTKSRIQLSELAFDQLLPVVNEAKKKSIEAWKTAGDNIKKKIGQEPHTAINEQIDKFARVEEKEEKLTEETLAPKERKTATERRKASEEEAPATPEASKKLVEGGERVQYVPSLLNNQLWERAHDPEHGLIVRVNQSHRFYRDIMEPQHDNAPLLMVLDLFFFGLALTEYKVIYNSDVDLKFVEKLMTEFRETAGNNISEAVRLIDLATINDK